MRNIWTDEEVADELEDYMEKRQIQLKMVNGNLEGYYEAMELDMVEEIVAALCGDECTGDFRTDIIKSAYLANVYAHEGTYGCYDIKSYLLEYVFSHNTWGIEPYDSYGIGTDSYGNDVAYFDVPDCGQVSFHLVDTFFDDSVPDYEYSWCQTRNLEFPSYSRIENYHNLLFALGYRDFDLSGDVTTALSPINYSEIRDAEELHTAYFADLTYFSDIFRYSDINFYDESILDTIIIVEVQFSKKDGITNKKSITDHQQKIELLKRYSIFNNLVTEALINLGILNRDGEER